MIGMPNRRRYPESARPGGLARALAGWRAPWRGGAEPGYAGAAPRRRHMAAFRGPARRGVKLSASKRRRKAGVNLGRAPRTPDRDAPSRFRAGRPPDAPALTCVAVLSQETLTQRKGREPAAGRRAWEPRRRSTTRRSGLGSGTARRTPAPARSAPGRARTPDGAIDPAPILSVVVRMQFGVEMGLTPHCSRASVSNRLRDVIVSAVERGDRPLTRNGRPGDRIYPNGGEERTCPLTEWAALRP